MAQWKIRRRAGTCSACDRPFEEGERLVSTLRASEDGLERAECCVGWWEGRSGSAASEACAQACRQRVERGAEPTAEDLFWWYSRHSQSRRRSLQLDLESLERLFLELEGRPELAVRELRYVLCLLLMRKRRLKVVKIERDSEGETFLVQRPRHDQRFRVHVFDFTPDRLEEVRVQLQSIFDGGEGLESDPTAKRERATEPDAADESEAAEAPAAQGD